MSKVIPFKKPAAKEVVKTDKKWPLQTQQQSFRFNPEGADERARFIANVIIMTCNDTGFDCLSMSTLNKVVRELQARNFLVDEKNNR
jgi:hypothetical protein